MSNLFSDLQKTREEQRQIIRKKPTVKTSKPTRTITRARELSRDHPRVVSRGSSRDKSPDLPTRDEVQEFSFRLRDELKVKVQAEVPHSWQTELDELARKMDVKKLELYRFILGEFLGKVRRKKET